MGRLYERPGCSNLNFFRNGKRIFEFDAQVARGAVHFRMAQQELDCPQVAGFLVDLRNLGPPHRVGSVSCRFQAH